MAKDPLVVDVIPFPGLIICLIRVGSRYTINSISSQTNSQPV